MSGIVTPSTDGSLGFTPLTPTSSITSGIGPGAPAVVPVSTGKVTSGTGSGSPAAGTGVATVSNNKIPTVVAPPNRQGINGGFSYVLPNTGNAQVYQVRVLGVGYGAQQLASETMSRTRRAFYPRNVVATAFNVQLLLVGSAERASFSNYIQNYATNYLAPSSSFPPIMTFTCAPMNISQTGIPISGFEWGDSVGAIVWTPTITIQPTDATFTPSGVQRTGGSGISNLDQKSYQNVLKIAPEVKYFIPEGIQLTGDQAPPDGGWNTNGSASPITPAAVDNLVVNGTPHPLGNPATKGLGGK